MAYANDGKIGINVAADPTTTPDQKPGLTVTMDDGTKWIYLKASATITQYGCCVSVDGTTTQMTTSTLALRGMAHCIAQQAYTTGQYGWFLLANPLGVTTYKVRVAASCAIDAKLATTAFAGTLDDTTAGTVLRLDGYVLTDSQPSGSSGSRTFRTTHFPSAGGGAV